MCLCLKNNVAMNFYDSLLYMLNEMSPYILLGFLTQDCCMRLYREKLSHVIYQANPLAV